MKFTKEAALDAADELMKGLFEARSLPRDELSDADYVELYEASWRAFEATSGWTHDEIEAEIEAAYKAWAAANR